MAIDPCVFEDSEQRRVLRVTFGKIERHTSIGAGHAYFAREHLAELDDEAEEALIDALHTRISVVRDAVNDAGEDGCIDGGEMDALADEIEQVSERIALLSEYDEVENARHDSAIERIEQCRASLAEVTFPLFNIDAAFDFQVPIINGGGESHAGEGAAANNSSRPTDAGIATQTTHGPGAHTPQHGDGS